MASGATRAVGFAPTTPLPDSVLGVRPSSLGVSQFCSSCKPSRPARRAVAKGPCDITALYLDTSSIEVNWRTPDRRGSFGKVWFGHETTTETDIVVKCPIDTDKARTLLKVEEHTNAKLVRVAQSKRNTTPYMRWADYLGKVIVPRDAPLVDGVSRFGLVWRRAGEGETLEDYLQGYRIRELGSLMKTGGEVGGLRVKLAERMFVELVELLVALDDAGIVHRDIKPDNIVVDTEGPFPLRCIDFGSSCDWGSPFKTGLLTATCDPFYSAPERKLDIMSANKYDTYSVGLVCLRCLFPSLTARHEMEEFVTGDLKRWGCFERFLYAAATGQAGTPGGTQSDASVLDNSPALAPMRSLLCSMLTVKPSDRADVDTCLRSSFLASKFSNAM